jgi:GNAT superfamily N-acetyltransferase
MTAFTVVRTYLELDPSAPTPEPWLPRGATVERVVDCPPSFYRFLYTEVGRPHRWTDRLGWDDERIRAHLADPARSLDVLYVAGAPAGYFELEDEADGSVQIAYFGLLPDRTGRGLGRALLESAIAEARQRAVRVWLHTCTLDHAAAMPNYTKRGFRPVREERYQVTLDLPATESPTYRLVRDALLARRQVTALYHGARRELCPHVLGVQGERAVCLFYQFGGESAGEPVHGGGTENWRCMLLDELTDVAARDGQWFTAETAGRRQHCVALVDVEVASAEGA